ncbi:phosphatase PAP2 family protein [Candidatus Woesearchaeota archaeon]|nr:phosphatase PAP2 family protein [Candidatus Woesearchaeota archaeon]
MHYEEFLNDSSSLGGFTAYIAVILLFFLTENPVAVNQLLVSFVAISVLIVATRILHYKERPIKRPYESWLEKVQASSFPSGHAARITSLLIISGKHLQLDYFSVLALVVVCLVVGSRIALKKHEAVDALFGIILGTAVSLASILLMPGNA